jgi:acyl-CoA thioester hydrolase
MPNYFSCNMRVYFEDTDGFGVVHHANYLKFMERARLNWLLKLGYRLDELSRQNVLFVVQKAELQFLMAVRCYDEIEILTRVVKSRRVAKVYEQIIRSAKDSEIIYCKGYIHVVCVNEKLRPRPMPQELLEMMQ